MDRYEATGTPYPDPETCCPGRCDGMGCYPRRRSAIVRFFRLVAWWLYPGLFHLELRPEAYEFVTCETCRGTGRRR